MNFSFSIGGERKVNKCEKALVAQKNDVQNFKDVDENNKVTFDEKLLKCDSKTEKDVEKKLKRKTRRKKK